MAENPEIPSVYRAIACPTRRVLLDKLSSRDQSVQRLAASLKMSVPAISQQLSVLRKAGLVTVRRAGRWRVYRLHPEGLRQVLAWLQPYERFWVARLQALGQDLKTIESSEPRWR